MLAQDQIQFSVTCTWFCLSELRNGRKRLDGQVRTLIACKAFADPDFTVRWRTGQLRVVGKNKKCSVLLEEPNGMTELTRSVAFQGFSSAVAEKEMGGGVQTPTMTQTAAGSALEFVSGARKGGLSVFSANNGFRLSS